ncbi:hypothetical protein JXI42_01375 [bacterium]|nr:hypothetical protein [bacterium]
MPETALKRKRLSIDLSPEEHRKIKAYSVIHDKTIREYVLEAVREQIRIEEDKHLNSITTNISTVLKELWDNKKDASYDQI